MCNNFLNGWNKVDESCYAFNNYLEDIEFYHSITQCINDGMYFKNIGGVVCITKASSIMGGFSLINCCHPLGEIDYKCFLANGITVRNSKVTKGEKDLYGCEYIYDTTQYINMVGGGYERHRRVLRNAKGVTYVNGVNNDIADIVEKWSANKKESHQIKLLKTILKNQKHLKITTTYKGDVAIGFSVIEMVNKDNGIILQRLINPVKESYDLVEPNFILHYNDCLQFPDKFLNMGSSVGIKKMEVAKLKLKPCKKQYIFRLRRKTTKLQYQTLKNNQ